MKIKDLRRKRIKTKVVAPKTQMGFRIQDEYVPAIVMAADAKGVSVSRLLCDLVTEYAKSLLIQRKPEPKSDPKSLSEPKSPDNQRVWAAYSESYYRRYGVQPVRNARVNGQVAHLVTRLGVEDAIDTVRFYLTHEDNFFVKNSHSLGLCLNQCEALRTQMLTGRAVTQQGLQRQQDRTKAQKTQDSLDEIARKWGLDAKEVK